MGQMGRMGLMSENLRLEFPLPWRRVSSFLFLVSSPAGAAIVKLRKRCFLYVSVREMVGFIVQILAKCDGKFAGFVGLISVLTTRCR